MKTNRFLFAVIVLVSSIFADTIYLRNGQEVKDAFVTEIGVSEVKYKVGKREVIYTVRKSDIAIIFYTDGTKEVFAAESGSDNATAGQQGVHIVQNVQNTVTPTNNISNSAASTPNAGYAGHAGSTDRYENFTTGQRWGTWALNALTISGLGSWLIMGDVTGGFVHLGLDVAAIAFLMNSEKEVCSDRYSYNYSRSYSDCYLEVDETFVTLFAVFYISGAIWNIHRSIDYDKPRNVAYSKYGNFNVAVLPNKRGNLNAHLMYNKMF
ncbi:MAG: hypothetical protein LBH25_05410 [Fibromonadaceae bacterium]|jgi:hypothetical protein|nr:hypothetical protein [Fibromonadaceae bacterium]